MKFKIPAIAGDVAIGIIMSLSIIGNVFLLNRVWMLEQTIEALNPDCDIDQAIFYYHPSCGWCERQINEGGLEWLQDHGVLLEIIDVSTGDYSYLEATPSWEIDQEITYGYKTLNQLKDMFQC